MRSSIGGSAPTGSDNPVPRLSNIATRASRPSPLSQSRNLALSQ